MRAEFIPLPQTDSEIAAYRDALVKVGVGIETTPEALEAACAHVTEDHACITSDVIAAHPQVVNMIVHGGFEDANGRVLLVLPRDREAFRFVRDALADSHTSIAGFAAKYVETDLIEAIEKAAEKNGMALGPRSTLTLPGWYTIFPTSGDDARGRRHEARPVFDKDGKVVDNIGDRGGHISGVAPEQAENAVIDIPASSSMGLPSPCYLDAYLTGKTSMAEVRPGLARVYADRCYLEPLPHKHKWKPFWAYVPDYSERRYCAMLVGERCTARVGFKPGKAKLGKPGKGARDDTGTCPATHGVRAVDVSKAVLSPQPPVDWMVYGGLEPQKGHVHLWHKESVRWAGSGVFDLENLYCPLCDAEAWPTEVLPNPSAYMNYGPAVDEVVRGVRFPKEIRSVFSPDAEQRGTYVGPGEWNRPTGIQKQTKDLVAKTEKKFAKEIAAFKKEVAALGGKRKKVPLSTFVEISARVASDHGRRWKAPSWIVDEQEPEGPEDLEEPDLDEEDLEDES